jgi:hypothetical protein
MANVRLNASAGSCGKRYIHADSNSRIHPGYINAKYKNIIKNQSVKIKRQKASNGTGHTIGDLFDGSRQIYLTYAVICQCGLRKVSIV